MRPWIARLAQSLRRKQARGRISRRVNVESLESGQIETCKESRHEQRNCAVKSELKVSGLEIGEQNNKVEDEHNKTKQTFPEQNCLHSDFAETTVHGCMIPESVCPKHITPKNGWKVTEAVKGILIWFSSVSEADDNVKRSKKDPIRLAIPDAMFLLMLRYRFVMLYSVHH